MKKKFLYVVQLISNLLTTRKKVAFFDGLSMMFRIRIDHDWSWNNKKETQQQKKNKKA